MIYYLNPSGFVPFWNEGGIKVIGKRPVELSAEADEVLRQAILVLIDHALDCNDKKNFLLLTRELKKIEEKRLIRFCPEALTK